MKEPAAKGRLHRRIGVTMLTLYGLGTTVGAGIFVLIGEVVGTTASAAPLAFLTAAIIAGLSALSFAELAVRFPKAAGEAVYVEQGFGVRKLSLIVGLMVCAAGIVSAATIANGFAGYAFSFLELPISLWIAVFAIALGLIACLDVRQSVGLAAIVTVLECGTLVLIIALSGDSLAEGLAEPSRFWPSTDMAAWSAVGLGAMLAFYAFIGFEDMVNMAEETVDVAKTLPRAIIATLVITTALYMLLAIVAVTSVPMDQLAASPAPLKDIADSRFAGLGNFVAIVAIVAVFNGALIQVIMAARVFYGLARSGHLPYSLGAIWPRTGTPVPATILAASLVLIAAISLPLVALAKITSATTLAIFGLVNLALIRMKLSGRLEACAFEVPLLVPITGLSGAAFLLLHQAFQLMVAA